MAMVALPSARLCWCEVGGLRRADLMAPFVADEKMDPGLVESGPRPDRWPTTATVVPSTVAYS